MPRAVISSAVVAVWWCTQYTTFSLTLVQGPTRPITQGEDSDWIVEVKNTGTREGDVVVICYVRATKQHVVGAPPRRSVFGFERVEELAPQSTTLVSFTLTAHGRSLVTEEGESVTPAGQYDVVCEAGGIAATAPATVTVLD